MYSLILYDYLDVTERQNGAHVIKKFDHQSMVLGKNQFTYD